MFTHVTIRTKIISIVSLLLLALIGMGLLAANNIRSLNANTSEIANNWLPSIETLGRLQAGTIMFRATLRAHMLAETIGEKDVVEQTLTKVTDSNNDIRKS